MNSIVVYLDVNGAPQNRDVSASTSLLDFLRDEFDLTGAKNACQDGMCGNCTVLVDGRAVRSCLILAAECGATEVQTIEGLGSRTELHPLQRAFCDHFAAQCGFCTAGMILTSVDLLAANPNPTLNEVRAGLVGNICRCTAYVSIAEAVLAAGEEIRASGSEQEVARTNTSNQ